MKIVIYMTTVLEHGGGVENSFIDLASGLSSFKDLDIELITMDEDFTERLGRLLSFYYLSKRKKNSSYTEQTKEVLKRLNGIPYYKCKTFSELKKELRKADIVYSKNELLEAAILKFIIRYRTLKCVAFDCGTLIHYPFTASFQDKIHNRLYGGSIYKFLASGIKAFFVKNEADKRTYTRLFKDRRIEKIYNVSLFIPTLPLKSPPTHKKSYNITWVGRLIQQKGVDELVEIITTLNKEGYIGNVKWLIAGNGAEKNKIASLCDKYNNVDFLGQISHEELSKTLGKSSLFLSTSKWESLGNTLMEAISSNVPVLAKKSMGTEEILIDGVNGYFVESTEDYIVKIRELLSGQLYFGNISQTISVKFNRDALLNQQYVALKELYASFCMG